MAHARPHPCGLALAAAIFALSAPCAALQRGQNTVANPGFETEGDWKPVGDGFTIDSTVAHSGTRSLRCEGATLDSVAGAVQIVELDPPVLHPFHVSGYSRAERADVSQDYSVYLDVIYDDGTPLWGQIASFAAGSHDWQRAEMTFTPAKPVRRIEVFLLFRKARGTVWFDGITVEPARFEFRDVRVSSGLYDVPSVEASASASLPARWRAVILAGDRVLAQTEGDRLPIRIAWADETLTSREARLHIEAVDDLQHETITEDRPVDLSRGTRSRPYAVWTESSMVRVMPQAVPSALPDTPAAGISLAGHEYESFQIVLRTPPGRPLRGVEVKCGDLADGDGHAIPAANIDWLQVGYVRVERPYSHPEVHDAMPGWWPDPLLPVERFNVEPSFSQPIWVTVYAPTGTRPGTYRGRVTLRPEGAPETQVAVTARVYPFSLPVRGHLKTAFALMDGYLEQTYGKPLSPQLRQAYGDFVLRHRLNPDDISRTDPPAIGDLKHCADHGLNAFNVLNMVEPRGERAWVCWSPPEIYTPEFKQALIDRLTPYMTELRRARLSDRAYIYTFDERGKEFYPIIREYFGMVKERWPEVRTLTTSQVPQDPDVMRDLNVDWNCPLTAAYRLEEAERCRQAGLQVWAYVCLGPRYPYANFLADDPLVEARVIWWQAYHQKFDGFLYWGLNIWDRPHNDEPIDASHGPFLDWSITTGGDYDWLHGDGRLLYGGIDGPIGSIRLANIRDGLEDYEYLWMLADLAGDVELARRTCERVTTDLTHFTRDPAVVAQVRDRIAVRIAAALASR